MRFPLFIASVSAVAITALAADAANQTMFEYLYKRKDSKFEKFANNA
jgi:hypothetical protein